MKAKEFWAALHDHSLTNYLDAVVLLEVVIENRKAILKQGEIPSLDDAVKLLTTARGEFREVARLSNYTKNNIIPIPNNAIPKIIPITNSGHTFLISLLNFLVCNFFLSSMFLYFILVHPHSIYFFTNKITLFITS